MITEERQQVILSLVKEKGVARIQELVQLTNTSESTIRRDLDRLEELKLLKRVHGGASLLQRKLVELSDVEKSTKNLQEKQAVAQEAARLVEDGDSIFLDAGTTTFHMIEYLNQKNIVVVTNGINHIQKLVEMEIESYLIGGKIKPTTKAGIGSHAMKALQAYRFDKCFIGTNGIHKDYGYTTPDPEEAMIKETAMNLALEAFVLADHTKTGQVYFSKIADLDEATLIIDTLERNTYASYREKTDIKVVEA